jgi:hypothetical protein
MQHVLLPTFPSPRFKIFAGNRSCRWVYIVHFHRSADVAAFLPTFSLINIEFIRNRSCQLIEIHFRCVLTVQYHMLYLRLLSFKRENLLSTSLVWRPALYIDVQEPVSVPSFPLPRYNVEWWSYLRLVLMCRQRMLHNCPCPLLVCA